MDLGPLQPRLPDNLSTESGKVELAPPQFVAGVAALHDELDEPVPALVLVGRRHLRTNNSWSHNGPKLAGSAPLHRLQVHPDDAASRGVADGDRVRVTSATGEVTVEVELRDDLRPGVVSLPHGFGHDLDGVELAVARRRGGANVNVLTDRHDLDPLSGNAVLNAVPVEFAPA